MRFRLCVTGLAVLAVCQSACADGLIYQLPAQNVQARYKLELLASANGEQQPARKGSLTIATVGSSEINGEKCRWIEIKMIISEDAGERATLMKVLVPEKHRTKGQSPGANMIKAWVAEGDVAPMEFRDLTDSRTLAIAVLLAGPPKNANTSDPLEIDNPKLGKVRCAGVTGDQEIAGPLGLQVPLRIDDRLHDDSPFGLVTANWSFELKVNGQSAIQGQFKLTLTDINTTALTEWPDKN
ncbi:MAG: hypothetical protein JSS02_22870 [Planctomycetes bacterium]|nr:hypothetical protein [Planctomycetota bacterium]